MPVDLGGPIFALYEKSLARAKTLQSKRNLTEAASAYRQCADYLFRYAGQISDARAKGQWLKKAKGYRELADQIASGKFREPVIEEPIELADQYKDEIRALIYKSQVTWEDIGGLEETKREIKMAYGLSMVKSPRGVKLRGWRNILFYGPPGTGKTLLAAATSNGLDATFFNVKVSNLLSKYFGESSKLVTALFATARSEAPSVVFLDELESLTGRRGAGDSGADLRVVSTFLSELDGLAGKDDARYILTIGATNVPWLIDKAILSRFEKKIYVPLPNAAARENILHIHLEKRGYRLAFPYAELVKRSEGYSGRELEQVAAEAVKTMIEEMNPTLADLVDQGRLVLEKYEPHLRPLELRDFETAFAVLKPQTTHADLSEYDIWRKSAE